jgi:hypothetical protein
VVAIVGLGGKVKTYNHFTPGAPSSKGGGM